MNGLCRCAIVLALLAAAGVPSYGADRPASGTPNPKFDVLDQVIITFADRLDAGAATLAVNVDGKLVHSRGFGWRDQARKLPVPPDAMMRIASVSKPFTAVMVKELARREKLSFQTKAFAYLDLQPPPGSQADPRLADITVQHLLQHKAGWDRNATFDPVFRVRDVEKTLGLTQPATPVDVIRYMLDKPLQFAPGERSAYSNLGYCVLGRVIEKATGKPYADVLKELITEPLQIVDLKVGHTSSQRRDPKEVSYPVKDEAFSLDVMDAHGGLIASAPALCRFMQAYWIGGSPRPAGAKGAQYAFSGSLPGTTALVLQRPDGTDIAILYNNRRNKFIDKDLDELRKAVDAALQPAQ